MSLSIFSRVRLKNRISLKAPQGIVQQKMRSLVRHFICLKILKLSPNQFQSDAKTTKMSHQFVMKEFAIQKIEIFENKEIFCNLISESKNNRYYKE